MSGRPAFWARAAVRVAIGFVEPGPMRTRYRQELESELWGRSLAGQAAQVVSMVAGAPALQHALWESGQVAHPQSVWWCRAHLRHRWQTESTEDGARFQRCRACGADNDGTMRSPVAAGAGISTMTRS